MSPESDILIVGYNTERFTTEIRKAFRHWQVYSVAAPHTLEGRRFRRAYWTKGAELHPGWSRVQGTLMAAAAIQDAELLAFEQYEEPKSIDPQDYADAVLVSELRRSRYAADWN